MIMSRVFRKNFFLADNILRLRKEIEKIVDKERDSVIIYVMDESSKIIKDVISGEDKTSNIL